MLVVICCVCWLFEREVKSKTALLEGEKLSKLPGFNFLSQIWHLALCKVEMYAQSTTLFPHLRFLSNQWCKCCREMTILAHNWTRTGCLFFREIPAWQIKAFKLFFENWRIEADECCNRRYLMIVETGDKFYNLAWERKAFHVVRLQIFKFNLSLCSLTTLSFQSVSINYWLFAKQKTNTCKCFEMIFMNNKNITAKLVPLVNSKLLLKRQMLWELAFCYHIISKIATCIFV